MATILKGTTFNTWVTAGGMHALVEQATISDIERSSLRQTEISLATLQATQLANPYDKEVWEVSPSNGLATYDLGNTLFRGCMPRVVPVLLDSGSAAVEAGHALISLSGSAFGPPFTVSLASGATTAKVFAVALHAISPGGRGVAVIAGPCKAKTTGTVNAGEGVKLSSTAGVFQSAGAVGTGKGWEVVGTAQAAASGGMAWITLRR